MGPTAAGKSEIAVALAEAAGAEILSADSVQVYRGMDIGSAKPGPADRARVRHHLIDVADPEEPFTVAEYQTLGRAALDDLEDDGTPALIVGGSGLHFRSLIDPLRFRPADPAVRAAVSALDPEDALRLLLEVDPEAGEHVDLANPRRVARALEIHRISSETPSARAATEEAAALREYRPLRPLAAVGIDPGDRLRDRVDARLRRMREAGLLAEVRALAPRLGPTASRAVGYRQLLPVVSGSRSEEEGWRRARDATTALARRQRTFFRRDPRIAWLQWHDDPAERTRRARRMLEEAGWTS